MPNVLGRALAIGTAACAALYVAVNLAYLRAMPLAELARASDPARLTALRLGGPKVAALLGDTLEVTLDTYAHFLPDDDDCAREILGSFSGPPIDEVPGICPEARAEQHSCWSRGL